MRKFVPIPDTVYFIFAIIIKQTRVCLWVQLKGSNIILKVLNNRWITVYVVPRYCIYLALSYTWTNILSDRYRMNVARVYSLNIQRARKRHLETKNRCLCVLLVPQFALSHKIYRWWGSPGVNTVYEIVLYKCVNILDKK